MSKAKNFDILKKRVEASPERRERLDDLRRAYDAVLTLSDLREAHGLTQGEMAALLKVSQPNVSKTERKEDLYLSTVAGYVEALGGKLELRAVFSDDESVELAMPSFSRRAG